MTSVTIDLPDSILAEAGDLDHLTRDVRLALAVEWFRRGLISQGRAAELAGIARADFIDELAARKIPVAHIDIEELKAEIGLG